MLGKDYSTTFIYQMSRVYNLNFQVKSFSKELGGQDLCLKCHKNKNSCVLEKASTSPSIFYK